MIHIQQLLSDISDLIIIEYQNTSKHKPYIKSRIIILNHKNTNHALQTYTNQLPDDSHYASHASAFHMDVYHER